MRFLFAVLVSLGSTAFGTAKNPDTLIILTGLAPESLDPASAYGGSDLFVNHNVYETLIGYDGGDLTRLVPLLSTTVPVPERARRYRFPIREGVRFHGGGTLSPEDARYSLLRFMLADRPGSPSNLLLEAVTGLGSTRDEAGALLEDVFPRASKAVRVEGSDLVVELETPFAPFLAVAARWTPIVDREWAIAHGDWDGTEADLPRLNNSNKEDFPFHRRTNGTGPFLLKRWDTASGQVVLERNASYWGRRAHLKTVILKELDDFNAKRMMLVNGDADSMFVDHHQLSLVRGIEGIRVTEGLPILGVDAVFFNQAINPNDRRFIGSGKLDGRGLPPDFFRSREIREAFAHLIDYDGLIESLYRGSAERATGFAPRGMLGYAAEPAPYRFDPAKAERLLRAAFGGRLWERGFEMVIAYPTSTPAKQVVARQLAGALRALNPKFNAEVRGLAYAAFADQSQRRALPLTLGGWRADYCDPHNMARPLLHSKAHFAKTHGYGDPALDVLIDAARVEADPAAREALYGKIRDRWARDLAVVFTFTEQWSRVEREWVRGFVHNPIYPGAPAYSPLAPMLKKE